MGQLTQTTTQLQTILDDADASNAGNTSVSDASDTTATSLKKSGFYALQASSSNAPSTDRAVLISAVRNTGATGEIRYGQLAITESNGLWWNSDDGGSLGTWYEAIGTTTTQTLTNKTLTSPVLTTPQINDSSADHQYVFAAANLAADRTVSLPLLTGNDSFVFEAHTQTLTNKTLTAPLLSVPVLSGTSSAAGSILFKEDTDNGTNAVTLIGPAATADVTVTLPAATDTLVGKATTDTLTNKTLTAPVVSAPVVTGGSINNTPIGASTASTVVATQVDITAQGDLRLQDSSGGEYVAMQAPATLGSSYTLTMPGDDGDNNQVLQTNGSGVLSWVNVSSAGIADGSITTAKLADDAVTSAKLAHALDVVTSVGIGGGSSNGVAITQGAIAIKNGGAQSYVDFYCESSNAHYARILAPAHSAFSGNVTLTLPATTSNLVGDTATQTLTNKTLTSAVLNTGVSGTAVLDEDNMASDSATKLATQQSIKAYVDSQAGGVTASSTTTFTNKTLTAAKIVDGGFLADANGNELIKMQTTGSAVNELEVTNAATGGAVVVGTSGGDDNIDLTLTPKGTGEVNIAAGNLNYAGTAVTATGAELNILDGVTSTAAELNILDGVTATTAELNYLDIATLGLTAASKAVTADANGVVTHDAGISEEYTAVTSSSNAVSLNLQLGNNFSHDLTENTTISFANPAASGKVSAATLRVIQDSSARTITWHSSIHWAGNEAPTLSTGNDDVDIFVFYTVDAGTTYYAFTAGQDMS